MENVREKLAPLFDAPHLNDDERECLQSTLAQTPADELAGQLRRTSHILVCYIIAAEKVDWTLYCVLSEAEALLRAVGRRIADEHTRGQRAREA